MNIEKARKRLNEGGFTCVILGKDREYSSHLRGVRPLIDALESLESFEGAVCADKTVGAGAAHLYALLKVQAVWANVISDSARRILAHNGIAVFYGLCVPYIKNRSGDGMCPIETVVKDTDDSQEAYCIIKNKLKELER